MYHGYFLHVHMYHVYFLHGTYMYVYDTHVNIGIWNYVLRTYDLKNDVPFRAINHYFIELISVYASIANK